MVVTYKAGYHSTGYKIVSVTGQDKVECMALDVSRGVDKLIKTKRVHQANESKSSPIRFGLYMEVKVPNDDKPVTSDRQGG